MKVAIVSSVAIRTPPQKYGGLEAVTHSLSRGLAELGHDVTLIASKESKAPEGTKLVETVEAWSDLNPAQMKHYTDTDGVERE